LQLRTRPPHASLLALLFCVCAGISTAAAQTVGTALSVPQHASADPADPGGLAPGEVVITPGEDVTVPPASGAQLKVTYNVDTMISLPASVPLVGPGGAELPITLLCAQEATADHASPTAFTCDAGYAARPEEGTERWVYVGMQITAAAMEGIPAGVYSAEVVVTLAF
jgi:hypothetical protein